MKLKKDIEENQIEVLKKMGFGIKHWDISYTSDYGIVYNIDIESFDTTSSSIKNNHLSIFYNWEKSKISIQIFYPNEFMEISKECFNSTELHLIIIKLLLANNLNK